MFIPSHHIFAMLIAAAHLFGPFNNVNLCIFPSAVYSGCGKYKSPAHFLLPTAVLPGGRHHGHFPQMWQFKKIVGRGKFVAVSGRKVAVKGPKRLKCGRGK
jgi:hypothetical protein